MLLLRKLGKSDLSSCLFLEKKELFDAVMGVVGVLAMMREGGGLRFRSGPFWPKAAIFAVVDGFSGPTVIGGSRTGGGFFLD